VLDQDVIAAKRASDPDFDQIYKLWTSAVESIADVQRENEALNVVIQGQMRTNDSLGELEGQRHEIMAEQLNDHNTTVQEMGEEINRLRGLLLDAGINPDAVEAE
jgi:hypothetical protein